MMNEAAKKKADGNGKKSGGKGKQPVVEPSGPRGTVHPNNNSDKGMSGKTPPQYGKGDGKKGVGNGPGQGTSAPSVKPGGAKGGKKDPNYYP